MKEFMTGTLVILGMFCLLMMFLTMICIGVR